MKMANLHLFAFSSFCPQCAKVSFPSLPPPRHLHFFSVSQAHSSFCLSSFWFRFVSFRPVPSFRSAGSSHDTFSTRMSPASWRHICIRGKCVSMCVCGVCARTVNAPQNCQLDGNSEQSHENCQLRMSHSQFASRFPFSTVCFSEASLTDGFIQIKWLVLSVFRRRRFLIENACNMRYL